MAARMVAGQRLRYRASAEQIQRHAAVGLDSQQHEVFLEIEPRVVQGGCAFPPDADAVVTPRTALQKKRHVLAAHREFGLDHLFFTDHRNRAALYDFGDSSIVD
jgi:hypothetical protein